MIFAGVELIRVKVIFGGNVINNLALLHILVVKYFVGIIKIWWRTEFRIF
jgi:hypothetical protein